ncbi:MAG: T9SS type A sorting domain-containing protein [Bacteroidales bacterium]|nr:T9SS type A sorting domain-containing protein [Bacteroidales bacterium]
MTRSFKHFAAALKLILIKSVFVFALLLPFLAAAQISSGGIPPGFIQKSDDPTIQTVMVPAPETETLLKEDEEAGKWGVAERIGVLLPIQITPYNNGVWKRLPNNSKQWRLLIGSEKAKQLSLYFEDFYLPQGCELYVYNVKRTKLIGAFTQQNNHESGLFATELISGESLIIEMVVPADVPEQPSFTITDLLYAYKIENNDLKQFRSSGSCNVNVNCIEGFGWQDQKRGIVKINSRVGSTVFRCSGSLLNNTRFDYQPYLFTADHCARSGSTYASESDIGQWVFYFNYEASDCPTPMIEPPAVSLTGASLKANIGGGNSYMGSDFCLVLLNNELPPAVLPYFNGWSRVDSSSPSGVGIHHPKGDIKKISTYTEPLVSSNFNSNTPNMYWQVRWSETQNGHGVTEGGSSGSPIFNNEGLIVGQLTGGAASCTNLTGADYYGKIAKSWESMGDTPDRQLKYWLDPDNTGVEKLQGTFNVLQVVSLFLADTSALQAGQSIGFRDISIGEPTEWKWIFQGGEPAEVTGRDPGHITYYTYGDYDVTLIVKNEYSTDTLVRENYINVVPGMFPNPANDNVTMLLGNHDDEELIFHVTDITGRPVTSWQYGIKNLYSINLNTSELKRGVYIVTISRNNGSTSRHKLIIDRQLYSN